jgi:PAS domain S-box-containing protein
MAASLSDLIVRPATPVEAEVGFSWLIDPENERVLWHSQRASQVQTSETEALLVTAVRNAGTLRAGSSRLLRLALPGSGVAGPVTCTSARVATSEGGEAVLVTAVGLRAVKPRSASATVADHAATDGSESGHDAPHAPASAESALPSAPQDRVQTQGGSAVVATPNDAGEAAPVQAPAQPPAPPAASPIDTPAWLAKPENERRPLRFVWQTDANGMFVHVSRELAEAVGVDHSLLVGNTFADLAAAHGLRSEQNVAALLSPDVAAEAVQSASARRTIQILWPVANAPLAIPVEMAGVPVLTTARVFDGLRGYGICRIDQAVPFVPPEPAEAETSVAAGPAEDPVFVPDPDDTAPDGSEPARDAAVADPAPDMDVSDTHVAVEVTEAAVPLMDRDETPAIHTGDVSAIVDNDTDVAAVAASLEAHGIDTAEVALIEPPEADDQVEAPSTLTPEVDVSPDGDHADDTEPTLLALKDNAPAVPPVDVPPAPERMAAHEATHTKPDVPQPGAGNVVALHPNFVSTDPREVTAALSTSERNAFREIARALGARLESDEPRIDATDSEDEGAPVPALSAPDLESVAARLMHQIPMGTLLLRGGQPLMANRTLLDLLGYADLRQFTADDGMGRLFRGREPSSTDGSQGMLIGTRGGDTVPVDALMQSVMLDDGPATLISFRKAQDGSDSPRAKALELDLLAARAQLREVKSVLDTATDGIISIDDKGRIIGMNRSAEALFDYDQNEVTGERFTTLFASESHATAMDYLEGLRGNGVASVLNDGREVVGRERKGGRIPLFMTLGRVGDSASGKFCAVVRDITSWKKAEAELTESKRAAERSSAQKSDVLAKISHEIRTPLSAIIGFAEVMMQERFGPIGNERYREYVHDIHTSGGHVVSLVNDLLDLAKIEAGRMELSFTSVDLNEIVSSCVAIMQPQANSARVLVRSQLAQRLPPVVADARSVRQIVLNILSNAAKFTEPGGQVIISTGLTERGAAVVRVRDTGVGMSEADLEAAMEPFRQVSNGRTKGGTGLGLPLTKALVEANRAEFSIKSQPARGTLVEVTFPPTRVLAE